MQICGSALRGSQSGVRFRELVDHTCRFKALALKLISSGLGMMLIASFTS